MDPVGSGETAVESELDRERGALIRDDQDIHDGQARIDRQRALLDAMTKRGRSGHDAARMLRAFEGALAEWQKHRVRIQERITYLSDRA